MRKIRVLVLLATILAAAACDPGAKSSLAPSSTLATTTSTTAPVAFKYFSSYGLSFDYPATWFDAHYDMYFTFSNLLTYLSTMPLHDPCTTTTQNGGIIENCSDPISMLQPGGVLVRWNAMAYRCRPVSRTSLIRIRRSRDRSLR